jgi:hypothetical protein
VLQPTIPQKQSPSPAKFETLEDRKLMAVSPTSAPWGHWPAATGLSRVVQNYPWLNGGGAGVAVVDKGINYFHPALGGNRAQNVRSPRVVNGYDWRDNDADPFPSESEKVDPTAAHATGVAGIIAGVPYAAAVDGKRYQGVLQNAKLINLRTSRFDSQGTIKKALQWVIANRAKHRITAVNMTDFVGTTAATPVYAPELKTLWDAGVFVATPVANDWQNPKAPRAAIGNPAASPHVFGVGGAMQNGTLNPKTQRGRHLDVVGPSDRVSLPYYVPSSKSEQWVNYGAGNSWAAPHVTGAAVLIQQVDPTIGPADVMRIIQDSGVYTADPDAKYTGIGGYKRLDIYAAVGLAYARRDDALDQGRGGNDDLARAKLIPLNTSGAGSASNLKLLIHDHDYFAFDLAKAGPTRLTIGYKGPSPFPTAQILNSSGKVVGTVGPNGATPNLPAGRHYLHLFNPTRSLTGTYSLNISRPTTTTTAAATPARATAMTAFATATKAPAVWSDKQIQSDVL